MRINTFKVSAFSLLFFTYFFSFANKSIQQSQNGNVQDEIKEVVERIREEEKEFDAKEMIMHHVKDAHDFHLWDWKGEPISIPLPVILWTDNGLTFFMSSEFHHDNSGQTIVEKSNNKFVKFHEKIYQLNEGETSISFDKEHHPENASQPIDISITRNVFMMWVSVLVLLLLFITSARNYKKTEKNIPKGLASFLEPLIIFVRDEIAKPMIGEHKYKKYMPYLLTIFFFIWINNIFGLIPILNGANLSGNIAFTFTLALFTFIITTISGNKNYWKHIFWMPGVPVPMKIFLMPIEIISMFVKPISLMIRLFANITAGHIIILSLMSLIFIFKTWTVAPVSVAFSLFITLIEIIVTAIQAYIFTVLSALYFGMATEETEHH
jgi:F-type H+-transporting ATPase subunit a